MSDFPSIITTEDELELKPDATGLVRVGIKGLSQLADLTGVTPPAIASMMVRHSQTRYLITRCSG